MTGLEFTQKHQQEIGQDYTGYAGGAAVLSARYLKAMVNVIKNIYRNADDQREKEYLRPFTIIKNPYTATGGANQVSLANPFNHLLYAAGTYSALLRGWSVVSFDLTKTPVEITLNAESNIRDTEFIQFSTINSAILPGNDFAGYVKRVTRTKYALYTDVHLNIPASSATFPNVTESSEVYWIWRKYIRREMKPLNFDVKGRIFSRPNVWKPKFQMDGGGFPSGRLIMYPDNIQLPDKNYVYWYSVDIDELKTPTVLIDPEDDATTLEVTYPLELLYLFLEEANREYAKEKRDQELFVTSNTETLSQ